MTDTITLPRAVIKQVLWALDSAEQMNALRPDKFELELSADEIDTLSNTLRAALAQQADQCIGKDPLCPCQDGCACHYKDCGDSKAWPVAASVGQVTCELFAQSQVVQQADPVAWVLFRRDDDGLDPVTFYGGKEKPEGVFKDRFELHGVYTRKVPNTPQLTQQAEQGWVRVPVEPTQEMITAGRTTPMPSDSEFDEDEDYRAVFIAMVAAAPKGGV